MVSDGDADAGAGDDDEADGVGCGRGRGRCAGRVGRVTGPLPGGADHVRRTSWDAEAAESKVRVALPAGVPRVTVTTSVTLCPAASEPAVLLRLTWFGAELLADQRTGPSSAVRVIFPAEPVPTLMLPEDSCSVPGDTLAAEPACWPAPLFPVAGSWAGSSGWVAAVNSTWLRPLVVLTSGGGVPSWVRDSRAASLPDDAGPGFATPRPDVCGADPIDVPAATGETSRTATGGRDDPARAKAEVMTTAEATAPTPAITRLVRRPRRDRWLSGREAPASRDGGADGEDGVNGAGRGGAWKESAEG